MIEIGRLKGETVWNVIKQLEEPLLTTAKILSAMPVTQVSVERLFSSMKFILSDQRLSMAQELLESILYLRANAERQNKLQMFIELLYEILLLLFVDKW